MIAGDAKCLSIAICTHNPRADLIEETLAALRHQQPLTKGWRCQLLVIDNASTPPLADRIDLSWHENGRVVREEKLGLTHARFCAFQETRGEIILFVDDDNLLAPDYLRNVVDAFAGDPKLGATGGRALPRYEAKPPEWFAETGLDLACRDLGDKRIEASWEGLAQAERFYPHCAPVGAGMAIRKNAYAAYVDQASANPVRSALGRRGADLASGEDNDMIMTLLANGWKVSYLPQLSLDHVIPAGRLTQSYLERYARSTSRTWVQVLAVHGIQPWGAVSRYSVPFRKARAWLRLKAWAGPLQRVAWQSACGQFEGRAMIAGISPA